MKKINVIKEQCIGCGACVAIDSEHFDFDDEGRSNVISNENIESANLTNAIESCPTSAIEMVEGEDSAECNCGCEDCTCGTDVECTCGCEDCNCGFNCDCEGDCECDCEECSDECDCGCGCCGCETEAEEN